MLVPTLPKMSRPHASMEQRAWALMALPMGVLAGGVAGVLVNTVFAGIAREWELGLAVALATGAGSFANVGSVFWSHWSRGRQKVAALNMLQALFAGCLFAAAMAPISPLGLALLLAAVLGAQILWCGIITIRASVWRLNYSREGRTAFAARNQIVVSIIGSIVAAGTGWLIDFDSSTFRWLFVATGFAALGSLASLRSVRVRRERRLLAAESRHGTGQRFSPEVFWSILRDDGLYRRYMIWMMVMGSGNLMLAAPLILVLTHDMQVASFTQVMITAAVPTIVMPMATPVWARVLAKYHVIRFRNINSRVFVAAMVAVFIGAQLEFLPLLWVGAAFLGAGIGGGALGWNLGHNDFAPDERVADYLGLHISLTGIRGLVAPLLGVAVYGLLDQWRPGLGPWSLALPLGLTSAGALGFFFLNRSHSKQSSNTGLPVSK